MKPSLPLTLFGILAFGTTAHALNLTVLVTNWSPDITLESCALYDENGVLAIAGIYGGPSEVDTDGDMIPDQWQATFTFDNVVPGSYSVKYGGQDPMLGQINRFTSFLTTAQMASISFGAFAGTEPPTTSSVDDLQVRNLDVLGNLMNFGSLAAANGDPAGPAIRYTFNKSSHVFDTLMPVSHDWAGLNPAKLTWSFVNWDVGSIGPVMVLDSFGTLTLNGSPVLTALNARTGVLSALAIGPNQTSTASLAFGSATIASGLYSLAGGQAATSSGYSSIAIGSNTTANSYAMTALGAYNAVSSNQTASSWVTTDDLFVIGNGTSLQNRSNAVTIRKSGAAGFGKGGLSGYVGAGLGGVDIAHGGMPATLVLGAEENLSTRTHNTRKVARVAVPHYSTTEKAATMFMMDTASTANSIYIGGGTSALNTATDVEIWTGPDTTTVTGTKRFSVNRTGGIAAGAGSVASAESQFVVGRHNAANTNGAFMVGIGAAGAPLNAMRVTDDGAVLIRPKGDIGMGGFQAGQQP